MNFDVAVMWHIRLPNRSPSFEVFAVFSLVKFGDIFKRLTLL